MNCLIHWDAFTVPLIQDLTNRAGHFPDGEWLHDELADPDGLGIFLGYLLD